MDLGACFGASAVYLTLRPLFASLYLSLFFLRYSDGRVAMLAFLGVLVQEFVHLPSPLFSNPVATEAFFQVPAGGLWQIFLACGLVEFISHRGKLSYNDMFDGGREPGNFGFEYVAEPDALSLLCGCVSIVWRCFFVCAVSRGFETLTYCLLFACSCILSLRCTPAQPA